MTQENSNKTWSTLADKSDPESTSQSLGAYLQRERQKKQQTIPEVAEATRIPPETLKALESGNRSLLPVSVFTRGFVKIYAAHLGLNQAEILERFSNEWGVVTSDTPEILSGESMAESSPFLLSFRFYFLLLIIALLISLAYFFFQADDTPPPAALTTVPPALLNENEPVVVTKQEVRELKIIAAGPSHETPLVSPQSAGKIVMEEMEEPVSGPEASSGQYLAEVNNGSESSSKSTRDKTGSAPEKSGQEDSYTPAPDAGIVKAADIPAPKVIKNKKSIFQSVHLHIRFLKKTRISIAQDDGQPERFIFAPGEESTWLASSHITLHVDPPDAVELTLNGSPIAVDDDNDGPLAITLPIDLDH